MAQSTYGSEIPTWDGDPNTFERFVTACKWYHYSLKDNERHLAAARVWNKMTGPAKGVVRNLSPEEFAGPDGIEKFLSVLRESPLQKLPIPDSFSRLERWSSLSRRQQETIPQMIVREEELFTELQASLRRARATSTTTFGHDGLILKGKGRGTPPPSGAPTASPGEEGEGRGPRPGGEAGSPQASATGGSPTGRAAAREAPEIDEDNPMSGFFEDELRGYRLLKACHLGPNERQQVLTLTGNSTGFQPIRQALRSLYDEGMAEQNGRRPRPTWWTEPGLETYYGAGWDEPWTWNDGYYQDARLLRGARRRALPGPWGLSL